MPRTRLLIRRSVTVYYDEPATGWSWATWATTAGPGVRCHDCGRQFMRGYVAFAPHADGTAYFCGCTVLTQERENGAQEH